MAKPYAPCVECGGQGKPATGREVHPDRRNLWKKRYYRCDCGAYVNVDWRGRPLGYPAGPETRLERTRAHTWFDRMWLSQLITREDAYRLVGKALGLTHGKLHIAQLTQAQAVQVTRYCRDWFIDRATAEHWKYVKEKQGWEFNRRKQQNMKAEREARSSQA